MAKDPVQVNIPGDPLPPPDLRPVNDRLQNLEQLVGDLRERTSSAETSIREHLQHAASTQEALALASSAHDLASSAVKKIDRLAKSAADVPPALVTDLPAPEPLPDPDPLPEPILEPRKNWLSRYL